MSPDRDKPLSVVEYYDAVVRVNWCTALALQSTGLHFVLLLRGDDPASCHMHALLKTALDHRRNGMLAVEVLVSKDDPAAYKLSVSVVPQVRVYSNGRELGRHRGTMDYGTLIRALNSVSGR
jgi:hypothetical protein